MVNRIPFSVNCIQFFTQSLTLVQWLDIHQLDILEIKTQLGILFSIYKRPGNAVFFLNFSPIYMLYTRFGMWLDNIYIFIHTVSTLQKHNYSEKIYMHQI